MNNTVNLSPLVSEFTTQAQADAYDVWFRAKVQASIDDKRPRVPHDQAMAMLQTRLAHKRALRNHAATLA